MNIYRYVICTLMICLGIESSVNAAQMKPRAESVPAAPVASPVAITPRAASDSAVRKNQLVRGKSFVPEFLMKEDGQRTKEDKAMMELVAQQFEADKSRRWAAALAMGTEEYFSECPSSIEENFDDTPPVLLQPLFPEELVNTSFHVKPKPMVYMYVQDERESAKLKERVNESLAGLKLRVAQRKKLSPSSRALPQPQEKQIIIVGDSKPIDLDPEDELQFPMDEDRN